ncbi:MAG TPA: hypothetical protein VM487_11845 [Phycisphaerae bacterium]|nr:hypothetical protein [Phycisphaerae bacterium]
MTLEDLEQAGVTLPHDQWGKREVRSRVNKPLFLASAALAVASVVLMYFGDGRFLTWLGAVIFIVALFGATALALHAASTQGRRRARTQADKAGS